MTVAILVACAVCSVAGDYFSKQFVTTDKRGYLVGLAMVWTASTLFWLRLLRLTNTLATAAKLWTVCTTVLMLLLSQFVFKEPMIAKQWWGVALGFISLLLML